MSNPNALVQKLWNYCNILRDDGLIGKFRGAGRLRANVRNAGRPALLAIPQRTECGRTPANTLILAVKNRRGMLFSCGAGCTNLRLRMRFARSIDLIGISRRF